MEIENNGYIKVYRDLTRWEWYTNPNVMRLFIHCMLCANYKDNKWQGKTIKAGTFITSISKLAYSLNLSEMQIRTALKKLKLTGEISCNTTSRYTVIIINNWQLYQDINTPLNSQITDKQQADNRQITTNNKDNKEKKEKNIILLHKIIENSFNNMVEFIPIIEQWLNYKGARGQKYKSASSIETFIKKLLEYSNNDVNIAQEIVDNSIANNWQGIFAPKSTKFKQNNKQNINNDTEKYYESITRG